MKEFDLELIKQGHPIQMRDGRKLIFDFATENAIHCSEPHEDGGSFWTIDGHWQKNEKWEWNGVECCADIILKPNINMQLNLF